MKIVAIAANTLQGLIRNRLALVFFLVYLGLLLLTLSPLLFLRQHTNAANSQDSATFFLTILRGLVTMTTSAGSLFAMVGGAYAVAGEIQSGTILGVMARPLARWEFLAGSYLGVQGMLWIYLAFMLAFEEVLSLIAGQHLVTSWWILAVYPLIRYMLYSAIAVFFATFLGPFVAVGATLLVTIGAMLVEGNGAPSRLPHAWVVALRYLFPSIGLLSEERFLTVTHSTLRPMRLTDHLIALSHGLDYALVMLALAAWIFRRRPLVRA
jgi:Cu-processing system permease protein